MAKRTKGGNMAFPGVGKSAPIKGNDTSYDGGGSSNQGHVGPSGPRIGPGAFASRVTGEYARQGDKSISPSVTNMRVDRTSE